MNGMAISQQGVLLVTAREAASMLSVSERTLWTLTSAGKIRRLKIGSSVRYSVAELQRFVDTALQEDQ